MKSRNILAVLLLAASLPFIAAAQVYSPKVLVKGQPDATNLTELARGIYAQAGARTPRERAEAIWRFFNTDGRFVKPGFWYHIAGWAYEEPMGEVLDPLKLLNSYGFGLCYQIAPLLEAVFKAGGFEDARVWFLTGHTVTEVFYDGAYHHYDSDMMGYTTVGKGPVKELPVASVHQLEQDGGIIMSKLRGPRDASRSLVDDPWYPADVREGAMGGLAELFTTAADNRLFPFQRYPGGHTMEFVLRPGERLVRWFEPHPDRLSYLPHKFTGRDWLEFPHEIPAYNILTEDGPHSQKDGRRWATGLLEYHPPLWDRRAYYPRFAPGFNDGFRVPATGGIRPAPVPATAVFEVRSPYVMIDAAFDADVKLASAGESLAVETSTDDGRRWVPAGSLRGPHEGRWKAEPGTVVRSEHGRRTAVTGGYQYLVRFTLNGAGAELRDVMLATRIQVNPRALPALAAGANQLVYTAGPRQVRRAIAIEREQAAEIAERLTDARYVSENGQGYWVAAKEGPAELVFRLAGPDGAVAAFDAGGHFLDLSGGLAPDKYTAEVRKIAAQHTGSPRHASIAWSLSPKGPFQTVWEYDPVLKWKDGDPIDRTLCWPEVDRSITAVPSGTRAIWVRYRMQGMALDDIRLAVETAADAGASELEITHTWRENGAEKRHAQRIAAGAEATRYTVNTAAGAVIANEAVSLACPWPKRGR